MTQEKLNLLVQYIMVGVRHIPPEMRSKEEVQKVIDKFTPYTPMIVDDPQPLSLEELDYISDQIFSNVYLVLPEGIALTSHTSDFSPWLDNERASIDFFYWDRYKQYLLEKKGWAEGIVTTLDRDSDKVLDLLGNPKDENTWLRRGLIIGDIQSGKTANYTAIINKAADAGYQVILLFTGTTENLRVQTQSRIDMEFIGMPSGICNSSEYNPHWTPIGVAENQGMPKRQPNSFTSVINDFRNAGANQITQKLQENGTSVFVIKKNKSILDTLSNWLATNNPKKDGVYDLSALIIDDEADNASINTNKPENDPTTINKGIRKILSNFARASYLAVTATPYANIFIDGEQTDSSKIVDLFPSDYIYLLSASEEYIGASSLFSEYADPKKKKCIVELSRIETEEMEDKIPLKHKKDLLQINSFDDLPTCLVESVRYFLLVQGLMDYRLGMTPHRSMLINVSRFISVQNNIKIVLDSWLRNEVWGCVKNNHMMPDWANNPNTREFYELKKVWDKFNLQHICNMTWETYSKEKLWDSISKVSIISVNGSDESSPLDYAIHKNGYRVIAVGGFSLSRGLTLEGLLVSFFYRNSRAYDTLMQMGRWFGYRSNYVDVFKIWMSKESVNWYADIVEATDNLKDQIRRMNKLGQTPSDFGLAVQRQSLSRLLITARNKMLNAGEGVTLPVTICGSLIETPRLNASPDINRSNEVLIRNFIKEIYTVGELPAPEDEIYVGASTLITKVPKEIVSSFVKQFQSDKWNLNYQADGLYKYIESDNDYLNWDIAIISNEKEKNGIEEYETDSCNIKVNRQDRAAEIKKGILKIGNKSVRVGPGRITRIGLSKSIKKKIELDNKNNKLTDKSYLAVSRRPILFIYSLAIELTNPDDIEGELMEKSYLEKNTVFAIGLGFPLSENDSPAKSVQYYYNRVAVQLFFDLEESTGDDDNDE